MEFLSTYFAHHPVLLAISLLVFYFLSAVLIVAGSALADWFASGHSGLKLIGSNALFSVLAIAGVVLCNDGILTAGISFLAVAFCLMLIRLGVQAEMNGFL